ncbi:uncharacterized protein LOC110855651 [Folsomia candida]|uniref:(3S,6E)-nerolidol synthase n=1 Tax=Folsomia candida TaxID=158441 RepID=A0A226DSM5_FOLCA|nr:uncharacterized protein LOC110855651 [Folsomia candida]OXA47216.1 (3S,6E)-nerolidol synthase [Folsomia candida]
MTPIAYRPIKLRGNVKFKFPNISHPSLGMQTVTGRFRRIQPNLSRSEVDPAILDEMSVKYTNFSGLLGFQDSHFKHYPIKTMILTAVQFALYWMPGFDVASPELDFAARQLIWIWFLDDPMEEIWNRAQKLDKKPNIDALRFVNDTYIKIFSGKSVPKEIPVLEEFPEFGSMCAWATDLTIRSKEFAKISSADEIEYVVETLQTIFDCYQWHTISPVDKRYNLRTFQDWGVVNSGGSWTLEMIAFVMGIRLSSEIRRNPAFRKMINIASGNTQLVNDILGMGKDFGNHIEGEVDSELVFRVLTKGENLQDAVNSMCARISQDLEDLIFIKQTLIDLFGEEENLVRFLDVIDTFIDGQNVTYVENIRYKCKRGYVSLSKESDEEDVQFTI